jgi:Aromatic acid exporter family member 1
VSVRILAFRRRRARQISTAARAVAQRTPETLILVRHRAQPTAVTVARLAGTAVFAYLVALPLPVTPRPVLAPLTALLVAQVSLYQTLRSAVQRVAAEVAGVLLAVGLPALVGFTWWSLGITIVVALFIGYALRWATPSSRSPSARCSSCRSPRRRRPPPGALADAPAAAGVIPADSRPPDAD